MPTRRIAQPITVSCGVEMRRPANSKAVPTALSGSCSGSEPKKLTTAFCSTIEQPSVESSGTMGGAPAKGR